MVEQLEGELRLKQSYEDKLNELQETVTRTKTKLEETINLKSKELQIKDKEITGTLQSQDNTFKIIKNLESEVLNLQQRLNDANGDKDQLEKSVRIKNEEMEALKNRVKECKAKVEEALHVVEAALNEKDAALLREAEAKEETARLSQTLSEFIDETDTKIKTIRTEHETQVEHLKQAFQTSQEMIKLKESEIENYARKCAFLETETEKLRKCGAYADDTGVSKILLLEKTRG
ncbi:hypothetical protein GEV33_001033 [Tenebrio molitor]|nr:hypothetical protein GEV33_001033 [Tenebrio molitor]